MTERQQQRGGTGEVAPWTGGAAPGGGAAPAETAAGDGQSWREALDALHERLLADDHVAPGELADLVLYGPLSRRLMDAVQRRVGPLLKSAGSTVRHDALNDAVVTAFMSYAKRPAQYQPDRSAEGLLGYLAMAAHGDFLNALPPLQRHAQVQPLSLVELRARQRNTQPGEMTHSVQGAHGAHGAHGGLGMQEAGLTPVGVGVPTEDSDPGEAVAARERAAELRRHLAAQEALLETDAERRVLRHMAAEERKTAVFAAALGIQDLPPDEQQRQVKRVKDKIKKRLERAGLRAQQGQGGQPGRRGDSGG